MCNPCQIKQAKGQFVAIDDALQTIQWKKIFMCKQGYDLDTVIKEDNQSKMLLMKNGRLSSENRTKHLDTRYFYVKDLLEQGIIQLEHCMSEDMIADFFTKSLQGKKFQVFRDLILIIDDSALQYRSVLRDRDSKENMVTAQSLPQSTLIIDTKKH